MEILEAFNGWNKHVFAAQRDNGLEDIYDLRIGEESTASFLSRILYKKESLHPLPYSVFKIHDELLAISKDIKYITGILFCLRPYIINTKELDGKYLQNLPDRRYLEYCSFGLQSVYNYWDRIGDILHYYFPTNIKPNRVYFGQVKEAIEDKFKSSEPYITLVGLYSEIDDLLQLRNEAIHHFQIETKHYWGSIEHSQNIEESERLNDEKFAYPEKFKRALQICRDAFVYTFLLIDLLPDRPPHQDEKDG